jgi:uncharacterized surface protein with fasciclin (FAS1) repeats
MKCRFFAGLALFVMLGIVSTTIGSDPKDIFGTVADSSNHTILQTAVKEARLVTILDASKSNTLFAPTDEAFKKLGDEQLKKLSNDKDLLRKLVQAHLVIGKSLTGNELTGWKEVNGFPITVSNGLKIGKAKLIAKDIECSNGIMHSIDNVLIPK